MSKTEPKRTEKHAIVFGKQRISFTLVWRNRKQLGIEVHPDKSVIVLAPVGKSLETVLQRVRKRATWIIRQRDYFERFQPLPPPKRFISGETHRYLGRQYRLKVVASEDESVKLVGRFIWVYSSYPADPARTEALLQAWYATHAKAMFTKRLAVCQKVARGVNKVEPRVIVRRMKNRWGSCSNRGTILLNTELVKAPIDCIDYVIVHELCHLRERNHTPAFYRLLSRCMPDWERRKARLETVIL